MREAAAGLRPASSVTGREAQDPGRARWHAGRRATPAALVVLLLTALAGPVTGLFAPVAAGTVAVAHSSTALADLSDATRADVFAAMAVALPVPGTSALALHDGPGQISALIGSASSTVRGRDGARVVFSEAALGRDTDLHLLSDAIPHGAETSRVTLERTAGSVAVEEWWNNGAAGIEQGFTLQSRPSGTGPLHLRQRVTSTLTAELVEDATALRFVDADGERLRFGGLIAFDATGRDLPAVMRFSAGQLAFEVDDRDAVYPVVIDPVWSQSAYLKAAFAQAGDAFGRSVAISGDTLVVGAPGEDSSGIGAFSPGGTSNFWQGDNASIDAGAAYVFVRSGTSWSLQAYLKASNTRNPSGEPTVESNAQFGSAVAIDGDTIVIGSPGERSLEGSLSMSGAAYVFTRVGVSWSQQAYLEASNTGAGDQFGWSVAVSGDTIVVGAIAEDSNATGVNGVETDNSLSASGAAYVFTRVGVSWSQQAYLKASNTDAGDVFGASVAIGGDTIVVGAPGEDSNATGVGGDQANNSAAQAGAAYVFARVGVSWSQQAYLKASNTTFASNFGDSVAVSGETIVVGAPGERSGRFDHVAQSEAEQAVSSGAAYVFTRSSTTWSQQAYLKPGLASGDLLVLPEAGDAFGSRVAISGDTIVVGAPNEDSNATGVNGNAKNNSASNSGAAYVFVRSDATPEDRPGSPWVQRAYLKASNTGAGDLFGASIAISGTAIVVGAHEESGGGSSESDDSESAAGAAYVFIGTVAAEDGDSDGDSDGDVEGAGQEQDPAAESSPSPSPALSVTCVPSPPVVGGTVTCTVTGGDAGVEILWRAAFNPVFAGEGVTLDANGTGTFRFLVPAAALGQVLTVELVAWAAPASLGVVGGPVPTAVPSGEGPVAAWLVLPLGLAVALAIALVKTGAARRKRIGSSAIR